MKMKTFFAAQESVSTHTKPHFGLPQRNGIVLKRARGGRVLLGLFVCLFAFSSFNLFAQEEQIRHIDPRGRDSYPKNDEEWSIYVRETVTPRVAQTPIEKNFAEAELVIEGSAVMENNERKIQIIDNQNIWKIIPYTVFKGNTSKKDTLTIIIPRNPEPGLPHIGTTINFPSSNGVFFLKQHSKKHNTYSFINTKDAWISYGRYIYPVTFENDLRDIVHSRINRIEEAKCQKTAFYRKKKEQLERYVEKSKRDDMPVIDSLSHDTIPAGFLLPSTRSLLTIYGTNLAFHYVSNPDSLKEFPITLRDANKGGGNNSFFLHRPSYLLHWDEDSIQIILPSLGYNDPDKNLYELGACTGSGYIGIEYDVDNDGESDPVFSPIEEDFIVPYAINNFATNNADPFLYQPYEVKRHGADNNGGYTFVYDEDFYNNTDALKAFRRAMTTWECETGIDFEEICGVNNFCETDTTSTQVLVGFETDCFNFNLSSLGKTIISFRESCGHYYTDGIAIVFPTKDSLPCNPTIQPCIWNFSENDNTTASQYNFEMVALHEIGHLLGLQHVIDSTALMHWDGPTGTSAIANTKTPDAAALEGMAYIIGRDTLEIAGCSNPLPPLVLLPEDEWCPDIDKNNDDEICFVDLRMRDCWNDVGNEPNHDCDVGSPPNDWENIWASPYLWNCPPDSGDCQEAQWSEPLAAVSNKIGFKVYNAHPNLVSDEAEIHLYYTMASTGEMWEYNWIDNDSIAGIYTCHLGDEIVNSPVTIPAIDPQTHYTGWTSWSPPNFVNDSGIYPFYANPTDCGLSAEIDTTNGEPKYEICLLARIISDADPIVGEIQDTAIATNVINSNQIVTRNTFLIDPALGIGGGVPPTVPGQPSVILVANNNNIIKNLDILFDNISADNVEVLNQILEVSVILSPDLWAKWDNTGRAGVGVQEVGGREVKITNLETAKLLNIPFDAREFQPMAVKVTLLTNSGKNDLVAIPESFSFRITHESTDGSLISPPSDCLFTLRDLNQSTEMAQQVGQVDIFPNPFTENATFRFALLEDAQVSLAVYNLQGQLVKTLLNDTRRSAGQQAVSLTGGGLSNGMYLAVLTIDGQHSVHKMMKTSF